MKRFVSILSIFLVLAGLCACTATEKPEQRIQVSLEESGFYSTECNGLQIYPGQDALFRLQLQPGAKLVATDYPGEHYIWEQDGKTLVEFWDVQYPTQVKLQFTYNYRQITYSANGGSGKDKIASYDITVHRRPNTSIGTNLFSREGYTLSSWNTAPDGSGQRVGLGSRVSVLAEGLTLYAQWEKWTDAELFDCTVAGDEATVTAYRGHDTHIVVPESINGVPVTALADGAFADTDIVSVVLPKSLHTIEPGAFRNSRLQQLQLFDNVEQISDKAFEGCTELKTLAINAIEAPYGYLFRRESMYADKIDLLIENQGNKKLVCYGGCSMWYNLNGETMQNAIDDYTVINVAINGTVNSYLQMQILGHYLEEGDILFHTPELTSEYQLLLELGMRNNDDRLWCGLENNYDLLTLVDIRNTPGLFDSLQYYLSKKTEETSYHQQYTDSQGRFYMDHTGSIPFRRTEPADKLAETSTVFLDPEMVRNANLSLLESFYDYFIDHGVRVYLSYSCFDYEALPPEEQALVGQVDEQFRSRVEQMNGPVLISTLWDFLYEEKDFFDSAYHLLSPAVERNTAVWLRDILEQMEKDNI